MQKMPTRIAITMLVAVLASQAYAQQVFVDHVSNYSVTNDLVYGSGLVGYGLPEGVHSIDLGFDVFQPTDLGDYDQLPAVLVISSAGFAIRDRSMFTSLAEDIAARGYVTFVLDTRIISDGLPAASVLGSGFDPLAVFGGGPGGANRAAGLTAGIEDIKGAIDYVQANAATYDIDPTKMIVFGSSSGARIALGLGVAEASDDVGGVLSMLGSIPNNESLIDSLDASLFMINGLHDTTVPVAGAIAIADQADLVGLPYELHVGDAGHDASFAFEEVDGDSIWRQAFVFFNEQLDLASLAGGGPVEPVPELSSLLMVGAGLSTLLVSRRLRRRNPS